MKRIVYLLIAIILFSSCSHRIVRSGYDIRKSDYYSCDIAIERFMIIHDTLATKIGEIKLGESGLSVSCSEEHAINTLINEACAINADLIVITEETRPDFWSSCYRCRADFYRYNSSDSINIVKSDKAYESQKVTKRVTNDRMRNAGFIAGIAVAILVVALLSQ